MAAGMAVGVLVAEAVDVGRSVAVLVADGCGVAVSRAGGVGVMVSADGVGCGVDPQPAIKAAHITITNINSMRGALSIGTAASVTLTHHFGILHTARA